MLLEPDPDFFGCMYEGIIIMEDGSPWQQYASRPSEEYHDIVAQIIAAPPASLTVRSRQFGA